LSTVNCGQLAALCLLSSASCPLPTVHCPLPTVFAHCLLLLTIAHCPQLTIYYPLSIIYCVLNIVYFPFLTQLNSWKLCPVSANLNYVKKHLLD
jgi:hypothetical protein